MIERNFEVLMEVPEDVSAVLVYGADPATLKLRFSDAFVVYAAFKELLAEIEKLTAV